MHERKEETGESEVNALASPRPFRASSLSLPYLWLPKKKHLCYVSSQKR